MPRPIALIIALCLTMTGCAEEPPLSVAGPTTSTITSAMPPTPMADSVGDGRYEIGVDIRPGVWHTDGPRVRRGFDVYGSITGPPVCVWAIGYPRVYDDAPAIVTTVPVVQGEVRGPTDVTLTLIGQEFNTNTCQTWHFKGA